MKSSSIIISNQKGNITFYGMLLLLFMSYIFVHFIFRQQQNYLEIKERSKVFLCQKSLIIHTENFLKNIEILNFAMKSQAVIQTVSIFFPGMNLAALTTAQIKQLIQLKQAAELVSYLKNLTILSSKKCAIDSSAYKTPYELSILDFKRNSVGETILRKKEWQNKMIGKNFYLTTKFKLERKIPLKLIREVSEFSISKVTHY